MKTVTLPLEKVAAIREILSQVASGKLSAPVAQKTAAVSGEEIEKTIQHFKTAGVLSEGAAKELKGVLADPVSTHAYMRKVASAYAGQEQKIAHLKARISELEKNANLNLGRPDTSKQASIDDDKSAREKAAERFKQALGVK